MKYSWKTKNYRLDLTTVNGNCNVLTDADIEIREGEIVGLIGESGSGKSVYWKSALGLMDENAGWRTQGELIIDGANVFPDDKKGIEKIRGSKAAVIMQDPMSAFDQIYTIGHHFIETARAHTDWSKSMIRTKAAELLGKLGMKEPEKILSMYPFELSGGMLQRVMIAIALLLEPAIMICDEPTTAMDVTIQKEILNLLKECNREFHTSILFISHDLNLVRNLTDRVYVMYAGHIAEHFETILIEKGEMKHPYSKALLSARPSFSKERLDSIPGRLPGIFERSAGCPFRERCDIGRDECASYDMRERTLSTDHGVRCLMISPEGSENGEVI